MSEEPTQDPDQKESTEADSSTIDPSGHVRSSDFELSPHLQEQLEAFHGDELGGDVDLVEFPSPEAFLSLAPEQQKAMYGLLVKSHERFHRESLLSAETGLLNRKSMVRNLGDLLAQQYRLRVERERAVQEGLVSPEDQAPGSDLHILFIDFQGMKAVNDNFGESAGDEFIGVMASRIRSDVRPDDLVARWGGDEFVMVGLTEHHEATDDDQESFDFGKMIQERMYENAKIEDFHGVTLYPRLHIGEVVISSDYFFNQIQERGLDLDTKGWRIIALELINDADEQLRGRKKDAPSGRGSLEFLTTPYDSVDAVDSDSPGKEK